MAVVGPNGAGKSTLIQAILGVLPCQAGQVEVMGSPLSAKGQLPADEAPAGLDLRAEAEFYRLLNELKQEQGWAILQVSHDLNMVQRHCDYVVVPEKLSQAIACSHLSRSIGR